jgi:hypothetical protein
MSTNAGQECLIVVRKLHCRSLAAPLDYAVPIVGQQSKLLCAGLTAPLDDAVPAEDQQPKLWRAGLATEVGRRWR